MCQSPWLVYSGWLISNIKCLLSSTPAHFVSSCFANVRGRDTWVDFDPVNQNCSSGRSWSMFGQQRGVSQVSPETHICVDEPLFSVVPPSWSGSSCTWRQCRCWAELDPAHCFPEYEPLELGENRGAPEIVSSVSWHLHWVFPGNARTGKNAVLSPCDPIFTLLHLHLLPATFPWGRVDHRATNLAEQLLLRGGG